GPAPRARALDRDRGLQHQRLHRAGRPRWRVPERAPRLRAPRRAVRGVRHADPAGGARRARHPLLSEVPEIAMLSLRELERAAAILRREIAGHRIQQATQTDAMTIVLELYGGALRRWLVVSCDPERARVSALQEAPSGSGAAPPRFAQYLRAHLRGARVRGVELLDGE